MFKSNIEKHLPALAVAVCCVTACGLVALADGVTTNATVVRVELVHPQAGGAPMRRTPPNSPVTVSGTVRIQVPGQASEQDVAKNRFSVEFFLDDCLVHSNRGDRATQPGMGSFDWLMDTTAFPDGKHKLVVNFWDTDAPSAIGIRYLVIKNHLDN